MPDDFARLIASAQGGLADATPLTTVARRRDLIAAAQVQADCAQAVAMHQLANAVDRLVDVLTPQENE